MNIVKSNQQGIKEAILVLKKGGVIVFPTETAYGLGADFLNPKAVKKIYQIKGRQFKKPLPVIVSSLAMAEKYVEFDEVSLKLAKEHWPGALTIITNYQLPASTVKRGEPITNKLQITNYKTLGLRISSNKIANNIVKKLGRPITSTSANISGKLECYSIKDVEKQLANRKYQPDLVIDAGALPKCQPSTVVKVVDGKVKVLRKGGLRIPSFALRAMEGKKD